MCSTRSLVISYERARRAAGLSPWTLKLDHDCLTRFLGWMERESGGDSLDSLTHRLLTDYVGVRLSTVAPSTVWTDVRVLRTWTKWLTSEGEVAADPMARVKTPRVSAKPVPVMSETDLRAVVAACGGNDRRSRRDLAVIRLLLEGFRRGEVVGLSVEDIDLGEGLVTVTGKRKTRTVAVGAKTIAAIDRWLRVRPADAESLFGLTLSGLYQATRGRAESAGVVGFHPHRLRHTAAHRWLVAGGNEGDLMETLGWSSPSMLRRYGVSAAAERARAAQRSLGLADRV